jgi:hypothetical protein
VGGGRVGWETGGRVGTAGAFNCGNCGNEGVGGFVALTRGAVIAGTVAAGLAATAADMSTAPVTAYGVSRGVAAAPGTAVAEAAADGAAGFAQVAPWAAIEPGPRQPPCAAAADAAAWFCGVGFLAQACAAFIACTSCVPSLAALWASHRPCPTRKPGGRLSGYASNPSLQQQTRVERRVFRAIQLFAVPLETRTPPVPDRTETVPSN